MKDNKYEEKKGGALGKILIAVLIVAVVVIGAVAISKNNEEEEPKPNTQNTQVQPTETESETESETETMKVEENDGTETFAIFGVDTRANNLNKGTRSDSLMLVNVNHDTAEVRIVSIFRDTMVAIEGHGYEKITHAHSYGGPDLAVSTINENFDLNIEHYATVNFINVGDLVDDIGGIEMEITSSETQYINGYIDEVNRVRKTSSAHITEEGTYTLDGTQAVAYSRIRYTAGGDYRRAERQREVLFKIFEKAKNMGNIERIELAEEMMDEINTNYSNDEMSSLLYYLSKYNIVEMTAFPQVFYGGTVEGAWVEVPVTLVDMNTALHEALLNDIDYEPSQRVKDISAVLRNKVSGANNDLRDDED